MGNVCTSNLTSTLIKQYGETQVLNYVQSMVGNNIVGQQFGTLRNLITRRFNSSNQAQTNPGLLDSILGQVSQMETTQKNNVMSLKPNIP